MILRTSKGREVDSPFATDTEAAEALVGSTNSFAQVLLKRLSQGLLLSHDQRVWIHILATEMRVPKPTTMPFDRVCLLFSAALAKGLKDPRIRLDKLVVKLNRDGRGLVALRTSPSYAVVATADESRLTLRSNATQAEVAQLVALNGDHLAAARVYATRTSCCCFCGLELTTAESVGSGYGPICAEKWGLPWADSEGAVRERMVRKAAWLKAEIAKKAVGLTEEQLRELLERRTP